MFNWNRSTRSLASLLLLVMIPLAASGAEAMQSAHAKEKSAAQRERPLTNEDIVTLCRSGLGESVIIAKISQARAVDFKVDTQALVELNKKKVPDDVIAAMVKRSEQSPTSLSAAEPPAPGSFLAPGLTITLVTEEGELKLEGVDSRSAPTRFRRSTLFTIAQAIPGSTASLRITDPRPSVLVRTMGPQDSNVFFLVKLQSGKDERIVKFGSALQHTLADFGERPVPNEKTIVRCDGVRVKANAWKLVPKSELAPGEYAVAVPIAEPETWKIFDFGVDP